MQSKGPLNAALFFTHARLFNRFFIPLNQSHFFPEFFSPSISFP